MFNAVFKIPMQFFILLLGALVFVFYQFERPPVFFNQAAWNLGAKHDPGGRLRPSSRNSPPSTREKEQLIHTWLDAKHAGDRQAEAEARAQAQAAHDRSEAVRAEAKAALQAADPRAKTNDADYVFITFILDHLPHGVIGLLVAAFFAAALVVESRRTQCARLDDHHRFLPAPASNARRPTPTTWPPRSGSPCSGVWSRSPLPCSRTSRRT